MTLQERFDQKYTVAPNGCWLWTAWLNKGGYGLVRNESGCTELAHRVSWKLHRGPIPSGEGYHGTCVLHRCDNRNCVNSDHLFLGTQADNIRDRDAKGRTARGETHGSTKFTDAVVAKIRALNGAITHNEIGSMFGVSPQHVRALIQGKFRRHSPAPIHTDDKMSGAAA